MKLSEYAKRLGISYKTAWNYWKNGQLDAFQLSTGTIIVNETNSSSAIDKIAVYARVSSSENKDNLESQAERIIKYCNAKGYNISKVVKEIGSGVNDNRKKLLELIKDTSINIIVVEHKDRLTRFGFNYIKTLFESSNRTIEVINDIDNPNDDLMQDFISIITSFCARIYGLRRSKRKTEKLIQELENDQKN